jgi:hypothetical protein
MSCARYELVSDIEGATMKGKLFAPLALVAALLAACEDEGNADNDNLVTGSLVVVIIIVIVVVAGPT